MALLLSAAHRKNRPINHHLSTVGWTLVLIGVGVAVLWTIVAALMKRGGFAGLGATTRVDAVIADLPIKKALPGEPERASDLHEAS